MERNENGRFRSVKNFTLRSVKSGLRSVYSVAARSCRLCGRVVGFETLGVFLEPKHTRIASFFPLSNPTCINIRIVKSTMNACNISTCKQETSFQSMKCSKSLKHGDNPQQRTHRKPEDVILYT